MFYTKTAKTSVGKAKAHLWRALEIRTPSPFIIYRLGDTDEALHTIHRVCLFRDFLRKAGRLSNRQTLGRTTEPPQAHWCCSCWYLKEAALYFFLLISISICSTVLLRDVCLGPGRQPSAALCLQQVFSPTPCIPLLTNCSTTRCWGCRSSEVFACAWDLGFCAWGLRFRWFSTLAASTAVEFQGLGYCWGGYTEA